MELNEEKFTSISPKLASSLASCSLSNCAFCPIECCVRKDIATSKSIHTRRYIHTGNDSDPCRPLQILDLHYHGTVTGFRLKSRPSESHSMTHQLQRSISKIEEESECFVSLLIDIRSISESRGGKHIFVDHIRVKHEVEASMVIPSRVVCPGFNMTKRGATRPPSNPGIVRSLGN